MQKFIISVTTDALINANALFTPAPSRGEYAVDVTLRAPDNQILTFEFRRDHIDGALTFVTTDEDVMDDWTGDLSACGVLHHLSMQMGRGIRVNVLEILKAGMLVHAPANRNVLNVTLPDFSLDSKVTMDYRNDGTNLWAEYAGIDSHDGDTRSGVLAVLEACFVEYKVAYEVL